LTRFRLRSRRGAHPVQEYTAEADAVTGPGVTDAVELTAVPTAPLIELPLEIVTTELDPAAMVDVHV
jgi:hypothetical protein